MERFCAELHTFKSEIEERVADYFDFQALRCLSQFSSDEFRESIGEIFDVSLLTKNAPDLLNSVDRVFQERIAEIRIDSVSPDISSENERDVVMERFADMRKNLDLLNDTRNRRCQSLFSTLEPQRIEECSGLTYYRAGEGGIPIILINALGQGLIFWTRLIDALSQNRRVLIWEPRGVPDPANFTMDNQVEDLQKILQRESITACHLVGWCTGPKVMLMYYRQRPDMVKSMVFLNPSLKGPDISADLDTEYERNLQPLCELLNRRPEMAAFVMKALRDNMGKKAAITDEPDAVNVLAAMNIDLIEPVLQPFRSESATLAYCQQLLNFWSHHSAALAQNTKVPVFLLAAEFDKIASPAMVQAVRDLLPDAEYMEVRGATHYCLYDRPEFVSQRIETFFRRVEGGAAAGAFA